MKDDLINVAVILGFLILCIGISLGIVQIGYILKGKLNTSIGKVYCDNKVVYEGKLYRVQKDLETHNLQAPLFSVSIRHAKNFFRIEKSYFCSILQITD